MACETAVKNSICMVFGEISTTAEVSFEQIARKAIKEVGYDSVDVGKGEYLHRYGLQNSHCDRCC